MLSVLRLASYASSIVSHRVSRSFSAVMRACNADRLSVKGSAQGPCQGTRGLQKTHHTSESECLYGLLMGEERCRPVFRSTVNRFMGNRIRRGKVVVNEKISGPSYQIEWGPAAKTLSYETDKGANGYLPIAAEFNFWTVTSEQVGHNGACIQRHRLFHNHPAESIAYCVRLVCNLEGRGGQVRCGTSQLREKNIGWHGPMGCLLRSTCCSQF